MREKRRSKNAKQTRFKELLLRTLLKNKLKCNRELIIVMKELIRVRGIKLIDLLCTSFSFLSFHSRLFKTVDKITTKKQQIDKKLRRKKGAINNFIN